ncbi:hypothetical protein P615_07815 [Brevibacillus laterosporus PE36]|nr:hypothetical protein P615_07815 [Brevibacillus laterosporus PE36]
MSRRGETWDISPLLCNGVIMVRFKRIKDVGFFVKIIKGQ